MLFLVPPPGHHITPQGIQPMPGLVEKIVNWPKPTTVKHVRSFVQTANYYRKFIPKFADIAAPLQKMFSKHAKYIWEEEQEIAFYTLKRILSE